MTAEELRQVKQVKHREWLWLFAAFTFFLGALLWEGYDRLTLDRTPPIHGDVVLVPVNETISQGKSLVVRAIREKVRDDCIPLFSERWVINIASGETTQLPARVWGGGSTDADFVDVSFDTSKLLPGEYQGYARSTYPCPELPSFVYEATFQFSVVGG